MTEKRKPVHEIRLGRIRAAIWANQSEGRGAWLSVSVTRLYKDGDQWRDSSTFGRNDLPLVSKAVDMAYAWIVEEESLADPDETPQ